MHAEVAEVREPMELMDWPEASEDTEEEELVRFMNDGRGGASDPNSMIPCSSTRISRLDVSAKADKRSWLFLGVILGRRSVERDWEELLEARDTREVLDGLRVNRERRDVEEFERGAAAGMTIPDFRMDDLENLGALAAKSGVGSESRG